MRKNSTCLPVILVLGLAALLVIAGLVYAPTLAGQSFGNPSPRLGPGQRLSYALELLGSAGDLTEPADPDGQEQSFTIQAGETASQVADRLAAAGLVRRAQSFRDYMVWSGIDTDLQPGTYQLSPAKTALEIGVMIRSASLTEVDFYILPGWRAEEIAAALPTSGLSIPATDFLAAVSHPAVAPFFLDAGMPAEGFLFPGHYLLDRTLTADRLVSTFLLGFSQSLTPDLRSGFAEHGLTIYQAVTLASIVQRETVVDDEMPVIASVFYNRLAVGMKLETDPTVQYALGYNPAQDTWWTNPLSLDDLKVDSPYNTYLVDGLPPTPIAEPGLAALQAVANPAQTDFLYFQARCDSSGRHNFAVTFAEHLQNSCP